MNKIKKYLKKITKKERILLFGKLDLLEKRKINNLDVKKIKYEDLFRLRVGKIRAIFHYEDGKFCLDFIGRRNDRTYKKLKK